MHIEKREDPLPDMGYEVRDINVKAIRNATIWFFGFGAICAIAGGVLYWLMSPSVRHAAPEAMVRQPLGDNVPLVQTNMNAKTDIMALRQHEEAALFGTPKQNKDGSWTIPIEAAMKMVAKGSEKTGYTGKANFGSGETRTTAEPLGHPVNPVGDPPTVVPSNTEPLEGAAQLQTGHDGHNHGPEGGH